MDPASRLPIIIAIILLFMAAFFAVTETALASVSRTKLKLAENRKDARAEKALYALENFDKAVTTLLICTNIVHIAAASLVTVVCVRNWGLDSVTLGTIATTLALFFAGEMLPKSIAKKNSEKYCLATAGILCVLMKIFGPLAAILTAFGNFVSDHTKGDPEVSVTEDELYDLIEDMEEEGSLDETQSDLISSALQFGEITVDSILTPRVDIDAIDIDDSPEEILKCIKETNHSRIPVYEDSIDNIIGVLRIREYTKAYIESKGNVSLRPLMDSVPFVHQSTEIDDVLAVLSKNKSNLAVVTDNYGGTLGIVTIEDILEELVGEIWDESDVVEEPLIKVSDTNYIVDADETVADVFDFMDYEDPEEEEEDTNLIIGEWVYEQFTNIPKAGDYFDYHNLRIRVASMDHNRILKLRIQVRPAVSEGGEK